LQNDAELSFELAFMVLQAGPSALLTRQRRSLGRCRALRTSRLKRLDRTYSRARAWCGRPQRNATARAVPGATLPELFAAQVSRTPEADAFLKPPPVVGYWIRNEEVADEERIVVERDLRNHGPKGRPADI
jgi:hypothetical protein